MGKIIIQQQGINHVITVPNGVIHFDSPNGGVIDMEKPLLIKSMEGDIEEQIESETTEQLLDCTGDNKNCSCNTTEPSGTMSTLTDTSAQGSPISEPENSGS